MFVCPHCKILMLMGHAHPCPADDNMTRVEKIIDHLAGTRLPLHSAMSEIELRNEALIAEILEQLFIDPLTNKWTKHVAS